MAVKPGSLKTKLLLQQATPGTKRLMSNPFFKIPYAILFISATYLFYNWKSVLLNPLHLFHPFPLPTFPLALTRVCSVYLRVYLTSLWHFTLLLSYRVI